MYAVTHPSLVEITNPKLFLGESAKIMKDLFFKTLMFLKAQQLLVFVW